MQINLTVTNKLGLHARAAGKIVELGKQYQSKLTLKKNNLEVDGSSILSILTLSCPKGTKIQAMITGKDSPELSEKLKDLFSNKFGEPS